MDSYELDSIRRKKERQKLVQTAIALVIKLVVLMIARVREQTPQMQQKHKNLHRLANLKRLIRESDDICKNELRVTRQTFGVLCEMVQNIGELRRTKNMEVDDYSSASRPPLAKKQMLGESSLRAAKKSDDLTIALAEIQGSLDKIANAMVKSEKREELLDRRDELLSTQKSELLSEISRLPGVSDEDAIDALDAILTSTNRIQAFYNCPNDKWKKLYVQKIIDQLRGSSGASQG